MELLESEIRIQPPRQTHSPPHKKTRDLPNLNECHACGFKADVCTGKNRLRTLYSEWRVVLLCKKCYFSVESSQICSYCLSGASPECFRCTKCKHSVHQSCFLKYKDVAPWSYSCLGSDFSVCVDCWIPKPVAVSRSRRRRGISKKKGRLVPEKGGSRVLGDGNSVRSMEDVVKDANLAVEKKVEDAARAREEATKKADLARKAVEIANKALSLVANKEDSSLNLHTKMGPVQVVDVSELTFHLHPHLNGSPKTAKSWCLLNSSRLDAPKRFASGVGSSRKTSSSRNASGCDDMLYEDSHKSLCEPSVSIGSLDTDSSKDGECTAALDVEVIKEREGSWSGQMINFNGQVSGMEHDRQQTDYVLHREEQCKGHPDRYFLKYSRRHCLKQTLPPRTDPVKVVDGSELTFGLHPYLNGTPTISKSWCLLNTSCFDAPKRLASGVDSSFKTSNSRNASGCDDMHGVFNDIKLYEDSHKSSCEPSNSIGSLDTDSSEDLNCLYMDRSDIKTSSKDGECTAALDVEVIAEELLKEGEGSCSGRLIKVNGEVSGMEHDRKQTDFVFHREEQCKGRPERHFLKYSRRRCSKLNLPPRMDPVKVVDGSELTFSLHPHLNGTPTISKSLCLLNTSCSDTPTRFASGVDSSFKTSNSRNASGCDDMHEVLNDIKLYEDSHKSLREPSVSLGSLDTDSSNDLNCLCMGRSDMKNSPRVGRCTAALDVGVVAEELLKQGEGSCSDRLINFSGEDCGMGRDRKLADCAFHREERCRQDRHILKYSRRHCLKMNVDR